MRLFKDDRTVNMFKTFYEYKFNDQTIHIRNSEKFEKSELFRV